MIFYLFSENVTHQVINPLTMPMYIECVVKTIETNVGFIDDVVKESIWNIVFMADIQCMTGLYSRRSFFNKNRAF